MDPFARELLDRSRHAHEPTEEDRVRVRAKLAARIGAGVLVAGGTAKTLGSGWWSWFVKASLPFVLVVGVAAYMLLRSHAGGSGPKVVSTEVPAADSVATPAETVAETPAPSASEPASTPQDSAPPVAAPPPVASSHSPRARPSASPDLEAEVALLASAQSAIQRGDYATALGRLDEHQRTYPAGVLGEERTAARVMALCGAGRRAEARTLATAFLARHPSSPLAPRVKSSCGVE